MFYGPLMLLFRTFGDISSDEKDNDRTWRTGNRLNFYVNKLIIT